MGGEFAGGGAGAVAAEAAGHHQAGHRAEVIDHRHHIGSQVDPADPEPRHLDARQLGTGGDDLALRWWAAAVGRSGIGRSGAIGNAFRLAACRT